MMETKEPFRRPLESHPFDESDDDFTCVECGRPRCLHSNDGFKLGHPPGFITMDPRAQYRFDRRNVIVHRANPQRISYAEHQPYKP